MKELNLNNLMYELGRRTCGKLCPMKMVAGKEESCTGNRCAWWDEDKGSCCVGNTEAALGYIAKIVFFHMGGGK